MNSRKIAFISFHACPLAAPGEGKSGGMNVYVRQLALALGEQGLEVDIFTRDHADTTNQVQILGPNVRVVHLPGGDPESLPEDLFTYLPQFLERLREYQSKHGLTYQAYHSHY